MLNIYLCKLTNTLFFDVINTQFVKNMNLYNPKLMLICTETRSLFVMDPIVQIELCELL